MAAARSDAAPGMSGEYSSAGEVKKMKFGGRVEIALNVAIRTWSVWVVPPKQKNRQPKNSYGRHQFRDCQRHLLQK